jgi:hypothetical protein
MKNSRLGVSISGSCGVECNARTVKKATDRNPVMDGGDRTIIVRLSPAQRKWLERGLTQPGGKLPLFDSDGRKINQQVVKKCVDEGWAEPWFANQLKPDWTVCKLTVAGRSVLQESTSA